MPILWLQAGATSPLEAGNETQGKQSGCILLRPLPLRQRTLQHTPNYLRRVEVFLRESSRSPAVLRVVTHGGLYTLDRLIHGPKPENPAPVWQDTTGAGVLHYGRFATRQKAQGPIADPRILQADARWFGTTELRFG